MTNACNHDHHHHLCDDDCEWWKHLLCCLKKLICSKGFVLFLIFFVLPLSIILLLTFVFLRPTPLFILQEATVYQLNVSSGSFLTSNIQVAISSRNPNKIDICYDSIDVYATYSSNEPITIPTRLPSISEDENGVHIWSPFIYGSSVPIAPYVADSLFQDQKEGTVLIKIKVDVHYSWSVVPWIIGHDHICFSCPAYITYGSHNTNIPVGEAFKYQLAQPCSVDT
ncbi:PREDICTED: NDR1/HIN1-like protein 12 [Nelumbo nucifera]|uniref:NDR1/HIN1-like protein 12 n=2 Tax=Nelumbo nucifera TaxID=4432 RepID=A0A1U7ZFK9_NELNU|nr:PREDICTED: NDR1/HIN1-like protein 12 [Nelumbo nucifera]DAD48391.1 TPA_asm: hypothetical protein HUJ06_018328 [Nelumbo nucifera]